MSDDEWSHPNKEWQETLDLARKFGWSSELATNHGGMMLKCPENVHKFRVYKTAKSTENVARSKRNTVRSCEHRNIADVLDEVELKLKDANRMLRSAEVLTKRVEAEGQMEQALEMLDEAGEQLALADAIFEAAEASLEEADAAAQDLLSTDVAAGVESLVGLARSQVREATMTLRDLPDDHDRVQSLTAWRDELRKRLDDLKARLAGGSGASERN
ncbi:hypothetical protein [Arthrobacter bambusae]|uniref:Uncharacterized protein n=1 Tax=Arthrobacter bambusae TaxID=1338426 RepID=A0AAW8D9Q9_9MICC|nr:hypothetical protein [Arthrobacter bambusae]MDP9904538.1 hypothetical protein [Arthrobacter bambusae]MDQ0129353.1 hypothetical protein [Arthrobacter bambusae]MDQ0181033.1 hypothetical protein [Arthrobacter bambusae]